MRSISLISISLDRIATVEPQLGFGVLMLLITRDSADVANGAWLNGIVGTQSLVLLGAHTVLPAGSAGRWSVAILI